MRYRLPAILCSIFLLLSLCACAPSGVPETQPAELKKYENQNETPTDGGTLKLCLFETDTLNPLVSQNTENIKTLSLIYDSLFTINPDFSYTPNLCESYTVSENGLTYRFTIRSGVTFHDGSRLSANDVDFSFQLLKEAESPYLAKLSDIKGHSARSGEWIVELKRPVANFPALLDFPVLSERCAPSVRQAIQGKTEYTPNGTGQYKVQSYKKNKELFLTKNEVHYSGSLPHISNVLIYLVNDRDTAIAMFENLKIDLLSSKVINPQEYTPKRDAASVDYTTNRFTFLAVNHEKPALSSAATRRALSAAINRESMTRALLSDRAVACDIPVNPVSWLYEAEQSPAEYDIERARGLLSADGWADTDNDGTVDRNTEGGMEALSLTLLVNQENTLRTKLAAQIKQYLEAAGASINVLSVPFAEYNKRLNSKQFDLALCEVDFSDNCDFKFLLESGYNFCSVSNEALDALMKQADKSGNVTQTAEYYFKLCRLLREDMPVIGLYFSNESVIFDESLHGNITPSASNIFHNITDWFIRNS